MNKFGLDDSVVRMLLQILAKYPQVLQAKLYGSRAKGNYKLQSDIDLAIYGEEIDRFILGEIITEIKDSNIPYQVDIQHYQSLNNLELIDHIDRVGVLIYLKA